MKTSIKLLRQLIKESINSLLREDKCPLCGDPNAYVGFNDVDCPRQGCKNNPNTKGGAQVPNIREGEKVVFMYPSSGGHGLLYDCWNGMYVERWDSSKDLRGQPAKRLQYPADVLDIIDSIGDTRDEDEATELVLDYLKMFAKSVGARFLSPEEAEQM